MVLQYAAGEIPCPLCLLQRVAMFGLCFGIIRHVRHGYDGRDIGIGLVWALFLLMVSERQVLLNIVVRPGHAYPGRAVLGLRMPVWSALIAFAILPALAATLAVFDGKRLSAIAGADADRRSCRPQHHRPLPHQPRFGRPRQCGFGACHTIGYVLL